MFAHSIDIFDTNGVCSCLQERSSHASRSPIHHSKIDRLKDRNRRADWQQAFEEILTDQLYAAR